MQVDRKEELPIMIVFEMFADSATKIHALEKLN